MNDTKHEAQGLEVVGHHNRQIDNGPITRIPLVRLSDATAVIDQLRERVAELEADVAKWKALSEASQAIAEIAQNSVARMNALKAQQKVVMPECSYYDNDDFAFQDKESVEKALREHNTRRILK